MTTATVERQDRSRTLRQRCSRSTPGVAEDAAAIPTRQTSLDLIGKVCDPDTSMAEIQRIVESDTPLSHRILGAGGAGAASGLRRPLTSIRHAAVLLGRRRLQGWIVVTLLTDIRPDSLQNVTAALTRARMCELLMARSAPDERDAAFAVGLTSGLPPIVHRPLSALAAQLGMRSDIAAALIDRSGPLGTTLADVLAWEGDGEDSVRQSGVDLPTIQACYAEALQWATDLVALVEAATG